MTSAGSSGRLPGMAKNTTVALLGGTRMDGQLTLGTRLTHAAAIGGMDLDLRDAHLPAEGVTITKVSLVGGVSLVVAPDVRVEVSGFTLIGGKDVERRPDLPADAPVVRVHAYGLVGGVRVRVANRA
jgi:hypothetical protein